MDMEEAVNVLAALVFIACCGAALGALGLILNTVKEG